MQHSQKIEWILLILVSLAVYACNQGEPVQNTNPAPPAGDTLQPYITPAEDAQQKSILLIPYTENGLWGFADTTGTIRIEPIYQHVDPFGGSNLTRVQAKDDHCGLIDKTGKIVEPMIHKGIYVCGNDIFGLPKG